MKRFDHHLTLRRTGRQTGAAAACALVVTCVVVLATPPMARAHAALLRSTPASDATLRHAPHTVSLTFDESVSVAPNALEVYDRFGTRVDSGIITGAGTATIATTITDASDRGTYTVAWRVTSADSHVIHGAFVFSVGTTTATRAAESSATSPSIIPHAFAITRIASLAALLVCLGAIAILLMPECRGRSHASVMALAHGSALLLAVTSMAGIVLQAAEMVGGGVRAGLTHSALGAVAHTRFGELWALRAACAFAIVVASSGLRTNAGRQRRALLLTSAVTIGLATPLAGHSGLRWTTAFADTVHLLAASVWVGGLAATAVAFISDAGDETRRRLPRRFSKLADTSVVALGISGAVDAYLEIGTVDALLQSTYGRLVDAKTLLLVPVLMLGLLNRRSLRSRTGRDRRFLQLALPELGLLAVVIALSGVLVGTSHRQPSGERDRAAPSNTLPIGPFEATVTIDSAGEHQPRIAVALMEHGTPARADDVQIAASLDNPRLGPLRFRTTRSGQGRFTAVRARLPIPGSWHITVVIRRGDFDQWEGTTTFDIPAGAR